MRLFKTSAGRARLALKKNEKRKKRFPQTEKFAKEMKIEELSLSAIKPYAKNPRKNDGAVKGVAESIKQFGFQQPIVIDKNNVIVVGHTRYKAAQQLGLEKVPCVRADQLTKEQVKAYRILDNKLNEKSCWDFETLAEELTAINFDFANFEINFDCEKMFADYFMESEYQQTTIPDDDDKNKWQIVITLDDEESCKNLKDELKERGINVSVRKHK